ncbi:MAG: hypothetical protein C0467_22405 [Planctomycetaceae bacterium]|nr:hypothetical protein [Planctomycetaceae bacterium]
MSDGRMMQRNAIACQCGFKEQGMARGSRRSNADEEDQTKQISKNGFLLILFILSLICVIRVPLLNAYQ